MDPSDDAVGAPIGARVSSITLGSGVPSTAIDPTRKAHLLVSGRRRRQRRCWLCTSSYTVPQTDPRGDAVGEPVGARVSSIAVGSGVRSTSTAEEAGVPPTSKAVGAVCHQDQHEQKVPPI